MLPSLSHLAAQSRSRICCVARPPTYTVNGREQGPVEQTYSNPLVLPVILALSRGAHRSSLRPLSAPSPGELDFREGVSMSTRFAHLADSPAEWFGVTLKKSGPSTTEAREGTKTIEIGS